MPLPNPAEIMRDMSSNADDKTMRKGSIAKTDQTRIVELLDPVIDRLIPQLQHYGVSTLSQFISDYVLDSNIAIQKRYNRGGDSDKGSSDGANSVDQDDSMTGDEGDDDERDNDDEDNKDEGENDDERDQDRQRATDVRPNVLRLAGTEFLSWDVKMQDSEGDDSDRSQIRSPSSRFKRDGTVELTTDDEEEEEEEDVDYDGDYDGDDDGADAEGDNYTATLAAESPSPATRRKSQK